VRLAVAPHDALLGGDLRVMIAGRGRAGVDALAIRACLAGQHPLGVAGAPRPPAAASAAGQAADGAVVAGVAAVVGGGVGLVPGGVEVHVRAHARLMAAGLGDQAGDRVDPRLRVGFHLA
jgi:hypothetical protein